MFCDDYTCARECLYNKYDYSLLSQGDVISNMMPELQSGQFHLRMPDGKLDRKLYMEWNTPWIFAEKAPERDCLLWHRIMFGKFGMLPIWCRLNCWKVVVRPRTIEELFLLKELQEYLKVPSKCGIETRPTVCGNYGGYFYTNSKEEGFDRLDLVKSEVNKHISRDVPVFLKLACTEFEHSFGPTDAYKDPTVIERKNEDTIRGCFVSHVFDPVQPRHLKNHVMQKWIHFAWERGDATVTKFNDGKPLFPEVVMYQREEEEVLK